MNRLKLWIIAALATALALSAIGGVSAQPQQPPLVFTGTVDGGEAATGLAVEALIDGEVCNTKDSTTFTRADGKTHYWVSVARSSQISDCGDDGETVRFRIGGDWASQRGTFDGTKAKVTLNLTLSDAPEQVTINVTVWKSLRTGNVFISTQPPGESWTTHNTPIDLSQLSGSGNFYQGSAVPVDVDVGSATVTINVTVWLSVRTGNHFISTQPPGASWTTHNTPIDLSQLSGSGNFYQGSAIPVDVQLQ